MVGQLLAFAVVAIIKAVQTVDKCMGEVVDAARANDYEVIIIADHGNADNAENEDGSPNTAHPCSTPFLLCGTENKNAKVADGILADVFINLYHSV